MQSKFTDLEKIKLSKLKGNIHFIEGNRCVIDSTFIDKEKETIWLLKEKNWTRDTRSTTKELKRNGKILNAYFERSITIELYGKNIIADITREEANKLNNDSSIEPLHISRL